MKYRIALAAALMLAGNAASAAPCSIGTGGNSLTASLDPSLDEACFSGNDTNTIDDAFSIFGETGWILADKNDDTTSGDGAISFLYGPDNGFNQGMWSITSILGFDKVIINLKAGNYWASFLVDVTEGEWFTSKDLSHASIYYLNDDPSPVPLPAGGALLLAALGALALQRRKS